MNLSPYVGIPYQNRGSTFQGCDCWGLIWLFYAEELKRLIPRYDGYADAANPEMSDYISGRWDAWTPIMKTAMEVGDVLALRLGRLVTHCGIYVGHGKMLHTLEGRMSCLEFVDHGLWHHAIVRVGRWKS